jgi:dihydrofolate reductase
MSNGFTIIVATTHNNGIGVNGSLPWKNITDMKYFKNITTQRIDEQKINAVIMGRKTFESLKYKPLPNRLNICITSLTANSAKHLFGTGDNKNILFFNSLENSLKYLSDKQIENIFVIGGAMLYKEAINHKDCDVLLINRINCNIDCDTFFPEIDSTKYLLAAANNLDETVLNERYIRRRPHSKTM